MFKRFSLLIVALLFYCNTYSQDVYWPSPEVEQMYKQAKESLSRGAIQPAISLFQQAIQRAPEVMILHRDLGYALNLAGDYDEAYKTVSPILENNQADEITYQVAGAALRGKGDNKKAKNIFEKGIKKYPHSGLLYNELGKYYEGKNDLEYALDTWLQGIETDPVYYLNYYNAAKTYAIADKPIWVIIYGEIFLNLERQTTRSTEIKKLMLQAYQRIFSEAGANTSPKYGSKITEGEEISFEAAVMQTLQQLAPVVSDGVTTENLTMLRTRFIMDWMPAFSEKYPFFLFNYQQKMLQDGEFEAYNQFVFGKAENSNQYESWNKFHTEAMNEFESWTRTNQFKPVAGNFYNTKDLRTLFSKKKKKKT